MNKSFKIVMSAAVFFGLNLFLAGSVQAATLYMVPKIGDLKAGQDFTVEIMVNTGGDSFNAAQATIQFPKDLLQVTSIDNSASASIFNFWLEGPTFSNENGRIHFIGGTTNGISGRAIPLLKINFQAKNSGEAPLQFTDSAITAADGSGSNILTNMEVASFRIAAEAAPGTTPAPAPTPGVSPATTPQPVLITRTPTVAAGAPSKPQIKVSLYPDQDSWYNISSEFLVSWNLPSDISGVATRLDTSATFSGTASEGLFESKIFPAIMEDGIWYLHVRFKNNIGWGPVTNYKIKLDTRPSSYFKVEFLTGGVKSDNPTPKIRFVSSDGVSGINHYQVEIDNSSYADIKDGNFQMPPQAPGVHKLKVKIFDNAGNFIEDVSEFEILPIVSPTINFAQPDIFVGENRVSATGTSLPGTTVLFSIKEDNGRVEYQAEVPVGTDGNWEITAEHFLAKGKYYLEVQAKDSRSALSLPVKSEMLRVREKPVLVIGSFEVTQFWLFMYLIILLLIGVGIGWASYRFWAVRIEHKTIIAKRDISNLLAGITKAVDSVNSNLDKPDFEEKNRIEAKFHAEKARQDLKKMEKYLIEEIEEIPH